MLDGERWREFYTQNGPGFVERAHISGLVRRPELLTHLLLRAVRNATTRTGDNDRSLPAMRAFRDTCLDYEASERLMSGAFPGPPEDIHAWLAERGGKAGVCLAFNGVEAWDAVLAECLYTNVTAPLKKAGVPLTRGLDWYCFTASAGTTPFGVHTDAEPSFIFHLGPAPKTAWTWPAGSLSTLDNGRPRTLDAGHLLATADEVCLAPGDFLLIPAGMYHLFRNEGPSMFLGLTVYPEDPEQTATEALLHRMRRQERRDDDPVAGAIHAFRDALADDGVERTVERTALLSRSCGYGSPPRFPARTADQGPPYAVTRLPVVRDGRSVFALGKELTVDLGGLDGLLKPGAVVGADELRDAVTTPELEAAVKALIQVGVLRSVEGSRS